MTFTPGPWKTVEPGHGNPTEYLCVQIGEDEQYTTLELKPDDARLIAACPDLLAALKYLWDSCGDDYSDVGEAAIKVRAAILKAEGSFAS